MAGGGSLEPRLVYRSLEAAHSKSQGQGQGQGQGQRSSPAQHKVAVRADLHPGQIKAKHHKAELVEPSADEHAPGKVKDSWLRARIGTEACMPFELSLHVL